MSYAAEDLQPLSAAIGRVVIEWNRIEIMMVDLGCRLAACLNPGLIAGTERDPGVDEVLRIAFLNMKLPERTATVRAYALKCNLPDNYFDRLDPILKQIDTDLRNKRNRYVHDFWSSDDGKPTRIQTGSKFKRTQSREPLELQNYSAEMFDSMEAVAKFGEELCEICNQLGKLEGEASLSEAWTAASKMRLIKS